MSVRGFHARALMPADGFLHRYGFYTDELKNDAGLGF